MRPSSALRRAAAVSILLVASAAAAGGDSRAKSKRPPPFDAFAAALAADWMRGDPASATTQQYFSGAEQDALDRKLTAKDFAYAIPLRPAARAAYVENARQALEQLRRYPRDGLTPVQRASAASIEWQLQDSIRMAAVEDRRYVFEQFAGLHVSLVNFLSQTHPIRSARDIDNYLARLAQVAPILDQGVAEAKARAAKGVTPPRFILQATLDGIDRFLEPAPANNILVSSLEERSLKAKQISADQRAAARAAAEKTVRQAIVPAFRRLRALLTGQLQVATDEAGISRLPDGERVYAAMLRSNTTTDMTAEQIHALGLREVARIEAEMDILLRSLGRTTGTVKERYEALEASVQPSTDPDPRPTLLAHHERILRDAERRAATLFDLRPTAPVSVEREPPFTERTAAAHYTAPAPDGTLPGTVWIPLPGPSFEILEMRSLMYHEGVPGHHFQVTLQQESPDLPAFRQKRVFGRLSAFIEGWGLYAEHLVAEAGWYEGDLQGHLGQLSAELFRARRLVADTGLHAMHWSRQQAIDYGIRAAEVDRYVAWPGQACAYKVGELEILVQRTKVQKALGPRFSLSEFHDWLLRTGAVPLTVLSQVIDEDIARAQKH